MSDTVEVKVPCRICALDGKDKRYKRIGMNGHLKAHAKGGWSRQAYLTRWPEGIADFEDYKSPPEQIAADTARLHPARDAYNESRRSPVEIPSDTQDLLADPNLSLLQPEEVQFYSQFYNLVLQAVDRDEVQMPVVGSMALDIVIQKRLRKIQLQATNKKTYVPSKDLEDAIAKTEKRIQDSMKALCISREMLMKTREQWKSTAAGLISGYLDEVERLSPEALEAMMIDEKRVLARMHPRVEKMILAYAKDLKKEQEENADGQDGELAASLEDALQRAGVSF